MGMMNKVVAVAGRANPRRLGVAGAVAAGAVMVIGGGGGIALAANSASVPATIAACYKTGSSPAALERITGSASCPRGYTKITWNQQGPQGPKGATGATGATGARGPAGPQGPAGPAGALAGLTTTVTQDNGSIPINKTSWTQVIATPTVTQAGTYYVSASLVFGAKPGDSVACSYDANGVEFGATATADSTVQTFGLVTIPVQVTVPAQAGTIIPILCEDSMGNGAAVFDNGVIHAVLISNSTGNTSAASGARSATSGTKPGQFTLPSFVSRK